MNAKKYARGQIWYWQDPIYGDKATAPDDMSIVNGENTIRYSRYVLIVQDEPRDESILVVPLTTKFCKSTDYRIPIVTGQYESFSYVKIDRIIPVMPRQLKDYICTVDDQVMKLVEGMIIALLCPSIYRDDDMSEMLIAKGLPMDMISEDIYYDLESPKASVQSIIGKFIKAHIRTGANISTSADDVYTAYSIWCYRNDYTLEKKSSFLDFFCILLKMQKDPSGEYGVPFRNIRIDGIEIPEYEEIEEIIEEPIEEAPVVESPKPKKASSKSHRKWDTKKRADFMKYMSEHSVTETAEHFALSENSVYKYRKQFAALDGIPTQDVVTVSENASESISNGDVMRSVRQVISDVSNYIKNEMIDAGIASYGNDKTSEGKDDFYKQISAAIYYSLMEYLEIKEQARTKMWYHSCPDVLTHMNGYLSIEALHEMMNTMTPYQIRPKVRSREGGIPQTWIQYLRNQLSNRLNISPDNIEVIISMIQSVYCLPDAA